MICAYGCLDENPKDQVDPDAIYNNADNIYKNAVASLYNYIGSNKESEGLQGTCRGIYDYNTLTTDEAMIPIRGGDWYDGACGRTCTSTNGQPTTITCTIYGNTYIR